MKSKKKNKQTNEQTATLFYVRFCYIINTKLVVTFSELSRYSRYTQRVYVQTHIFGERKKQTTPDSQTTYIHYQCTKVCIHLYTFVRMVCSNVVTTLLLNCPKCILLSSNRTKPSISLQFQAQFGVRYAHTPKIIMTFRNIKREKL